MDNYIPVSTGGNQKKQINCNWDLKNKNKVYKVVNEDLKSKESEQTFQFFREYSVELDH